MMDGSGAGRRGGEPPEGAAEALADAGDDDLVALGAAVLAELKDRGLLRVLLRHRSDAATAHEFESIREGEDGLDLVAAGFHAETPEDYPGWVAESAGLLKRLGAPGLAEADADALLARASDEALLLAFDATHEEEDGTGLHPDPDTASGEAPAAMRVAAELLRRGIIEAEAEE